MTTRLKELFEQKQFFVMAGGMNPIGAKMAEVLGYEVFYMSGGNTSAHQLGCPDSGSSMRDMVRQRPQDRADGAYPGISDADTGYGDAVNTYRTVREYIAKPASPDVTCEEDLPEVGAIAGLHLHPGNGRQAQGAMTPRWSSTRTLSSCPV